MVGRQIVVMGVAAAGKSAVGAALAARLGAPFIDADHLHPRSNIDKMSSGIPLDDGDRRPWLDAVAAALADAPATVVACSALKRAYRDRIRAGSPGCRFVLLDVPRSVLLARITARADHFMPASLLDDQLATLEHPAPDEAVIVVDATNAVERLVDEIERRLGVS